MASVNEESKACTDCIFYLASPLMCKKGETCEYRHSEGARLNPRECRYWMLGNCKAGPECPFRHPPLEGRPTAAPSEDKSKVPCYYFNNGYCAKGDLCPFSHSLPEAALLSAADSEIETAARAGGAGGADARQQEGGEAGGAGQGASSQDSGQRGSRSSLQGVLRAPPSVSTGGPEWQASGKRPYPSQGAAPGRTTNGAVHQQRDLPANQNASVGEQGADLRARLKRQRGDGEGEGNGMVGGGEGGVRSRQRVGPPAEPIRGGQPQPQGTLLTARFAAIAAERPSHSVDPAGIARRAFQQLSGGLCSMPTGSAVGERGRKPASGVVGAGGASAHEQAGRSLGEPVEVLGGRPQASNAAPVRAPAGRREGQQKAVQEATTVRQAGIEQTGKGKQSQTGRGAPLAGIPRGGASGGGQGSSAITPAAQVALNGKVGKAAEGNASKGGFEAPRTLAEILAEKRAKKQPERALAAEHPEQRQAAVRNQEARPAVGPQSRGDGRTAQDPATQVKLASESEAISPLAGPRSSQGARIARKPANKASARATAGAAKFDGPKPLSEILKEKRKARGSGGGETDPGEKQEEVAPVPVAKRREVGSEAERQRGRGTPKQRGREGHEGRAWAATEGIQEKPAQAKAAAGLQEDPRKQPLVDAGQGVVDKTGVGSGLRTAKQPSRAAKAQETALQHKEPRTQLEAVDQAGTWKREEQEQEQGQGQGQGQRQGQEEVSMEVEDGMQEVPDGDFIEDLEGENEEYPLDDSLHLEDAEDDDDFRKSMGNFFT